MHRRTMLFYNIVLCTMKPLCNFPKHMTPDVQFPAKAVWICWDGCSDQGKKMKNTSQPKIAFPCSERYESFWSRKRAASDAKCFCLPRSCRGWSRASVGCPTDQMSSCRTNSHCDIPTPKRYAIHAEDSCWRCLGKDSALPRGMMEFMCAKHSCSPSFIRSLRYDASSQLQQHPEREIDLSRKRKEREPTQSKASKDIIYELYEIVGNAPQPSLRDIVAELWEGTDTTVTHKTVREWLEQLQTVHCACVSKPKLTDQTFIRAWCGYGMKLWRKTMTFRNNKDTAHADEAWFMLVQNARWVRVLPSQQQPQAPHVQHKTHIPKVMFLSCNARPRPDKQFDGKIGIWRVNEQDTAIRASKNRNAGTREMWQWMERSMFKWWQSMCYQS